MQTKDQVDKRKAKSTNTLVYNMQANIVEELSNIPEDNTRVFAVARGHFDLQSPKVGSTKRRRARATSVPVLHHQCFPGLYTRPANNGPKSAYHKCLGNTARITTWFGKHKHKTHA